MKTYEKPRLMALSLTSNDLLCANCGLEDEWFEGVTGDVMEDFNLFHSGSCEKTTDDLKDIGVSFNCKTTASEGNLMIS